MVVYVSSLKYHSYAFEIKRILNKVVGEYIKCARFKNFMYVWCTNFMHDSEPEYCMP